MADFNPNEPRTLGVEWPAGRDHPLPLATSLGRGALFDAHVTEDVSAVRLYLRTRQGTTLDPSRAQYITDLYDADDIQPGTVQVAYSRPTSLVGSTTGGIGLPAGQTLLTAVQDWPDPAGASAAFLPFSGLADASVYVRYQLDPTWRAVDGGGAPTPFPVDLSDQRILSLEIQANVAVSQIWDAKVQGVWSPTGADADEQLLVEGGYWAGGLIPHNAGVFNKRLCLVPGGRTRARGPGNDLRPADVVAATTDGLGYIGLRAGYILQGSFGPFPWGFLAYDFVAIVAYAPEKRLAVGYGSSPRRDDPNIPGAWVEFPLEDPTVGGLINVTKAAGKHYLLVCRQNWFTLAGNDWRGLDSGTTVNWQDFTWPGIISHDVPIQQDFYWGTGLPAPQGLDPESTRSPAYLLMGGSVSLVPGTTEDVVIPGPNAYGTPSSIVIPASGPFPSGWNAEDGFEWQAEDATTISFSYTDDLLGLDEGGTAVLGGGIDSGGISTITLATGTHAIRAWRLTDLSAHVGDGLTWHYRPTDAHFIDIHIDGFDVIGWEDSEAYTETVSPGDDTNDGFTDGDHWIRVLRSGGPGGGPLVDGSQPYVRPISAVLWNRAVLHFRSPDAVETQLLAQGFSNATAADDYGVITVAVRNHSFMARITEPLVLTLKHDTTVLATVTVENTAEAIGAYALGDGLWYLVQRRFTGVALSAGEQYRVEATSDTEIAAWELLALDSGDEVAGAITYGGVDDAVVIRDDGPELDEFAWDAGLRLSSLPDPVTDVAATIEIMDTSQGLDSACAVATMERVHLTWTASGSAHLSYYEVERSDDDGTTWNLVAQVADPEFIDVEMTRNRPIRYRVRAVRDDTIWSEWTDADGPVTATLGDWEVVLGSNMAPDLTVCYLDEPGYEWAPVDAQRTAVRYLSGRDRGLMLREFEQRGDTFTRTLIVAFNPPSIQADTTLGGRLLFDPLLAIAHLRTTPHTTFCDHRSSRWYVAARVTNLVETEPAAAYRATVEFTEVAGPAPVRLLP